MLATRPGVRLLGNEVRFAAEGADTPAHSVRPFEALSPVLFDSAAGVSPTIDPGTVIYDMYRGVCLLGDRALLEEHSVRYDVTVIHPIPLGREHPKTLGHYHPRATGQTASYPEVYQVLSGRARYVMQKAGSANGSIDRVVCVDAAEGDVVVVPPDFGHVTVNPGPHPLVMANWVAANFDSVYGDYKRRRGACWYLLTSGEAVPNLQYEKVPSLEVISGEDTAKWFWSMVAAPGDDGQRGDQRESASMYGRFVDEPQLLDLLHDPAILAGFYD